MSTEELQYGGALMMRDVKMGVLELGSTSSHRTMRYAPTLEVVGNRLDPGVHVLYEFGLCANHGAEGTPSTSIP